MKITFVHIGREHLGIEYLSSILKDHGHEVELAFDPGLFSMEDNVFQVPMLEKLFSKKRKIISAILTGKPDVVAFSAYTSTYSWACEIAASVKKQMSTVIVFGGSHVTLAPEEVLKNDFIDYALVGESEYALLELVEVLKTKGDPHRIDNVWSKLPGGAPCPARLRPPILDLDALPLPDKALFERYINIRDEYITITSRGCLFNCSYCCESYLNKAYNKTYYRRRSPDSVMNELAVMKRRYRYEKIMFFDSILFTQREWLQEFLPKYRRSIGVPFRCEGHVFYSDPDMLIAMREAGCYNINFGVQSFNPGIRNELLNRKESNEQIIQAFRNCEQARLSFDIDLIMGLPMMTPEDYLMPLVILKEFRYLNRIKTFNLAYFPNLKITKQSERMGLINHGDSAGIREGKKGVWFYQSSLKTEEERHIKSTFENLYKIYPLIPAQWLSKLISKEKYMNFRRIPYPVVVFLQLLIGILKNDIRFAFYIRNYVFKFSKIFDSQGPAKAGKRVKSSRRHSVLGLSDQ